MLSYPNTFSQQVEVSLINMATDMVRVRSKKSLAVSHVVLVSMDQWLALPWCSHVGMGVLYLMVKLPALL